MFTCKVQEEEMLVAELRKIEMRKKEREKKQQDLQKLITAAENQADSYRFKYVSLSFGNSVSSLSLCYVALL